MQEQEKTLKQYAKEAKKRLKEGFWKKCAKNLQEEIVRAEKTGIPAQKVREYYTNRVSENIKKCDNEGEDFYFRVKNLLDTEGEVPDALGRLTDKEYFDSLSYDEKQRYWLNLSENYLKAVERYNREKTYEGNV